MSMPITELYRFLTHSRIMLKRQNDMPLTAEEKLFANHYDDPSLMHDKAIIEEWIKSYGGSWEEMVEPKLATISRQVREWQFLATVDMPSDEIH